MFAALKPQDPDKILALMGEFRADTRQGKIDLGVGVYKDPTGLTPVMRAVKAAERRIWETETTKSYTALTGEPAYLDAMSRMVLADTLDAALNAGQDEVRRSEHHRQAQAQIADFLAYVDADPLLSAIDANPFVPVTVHALLQSTLKALGSVELEYKAV